MPAPILPSAQQLIQGNNNGGFLDRYVSGSQEVAFVDTGIQSFVDGGLSSTGGFTTSSTSAFTPYDDPTYLGFKIVIDFASSPLFAGTLTSQPNQDGSETPLDASALSYLRKVAPAKADSLIRFANTLYDMQTKRHYFFQEIEGLDNVWKTSTKFINGDPYRGGPDSKISINCLESIDLKTTALMALYRNAFLDLKMRRVILPRNLREFDVTIYIQEIRKFKSVIRRLQTLGPTKTPIAASFINDNISTIVLRLEKCEWVPEDSSGIFEGVKNVSPEQAKNKLSFIWEDATETYEFTGLGDQINSNYTSSNIPSFINVVTERALASAKNAVAKEVGKLVSQASIGPLSLPNPFSLGNAFGISAGALNNLTAESVIAGINNLVGGGGFGSVFPDSAPEGPSLEPVKAFSTPVPPPSDLEDSINILEGTAPADESSIPGDLNVYDGPQPPGPPLQPYNVFNE